MRSHTTLLHWCQQLLPNGGACAQLAGQRLLHAWLLGFTVELGQLARQLDRPGKAKITRQYLSRWLNHGAWEPVVLYAQLCRHARRYLRRARRVLLLIDTTCLADAWVVLQVSLPFENRALPLYRRVYPYAGPQRDQPAALEEALHWLAQHLPGPRSRYVLTMDRGFPSSGLVYRLQAGGWRFVLRVKENWTFVSATFRGAMQEVPLARDRPRCFKEAVLGWRDPRERGPDERGVAHVVCYHGTGQKEPWYLVTSETPAGSAIRIYNERMSIEQEFRDLKGPLGLDRLAFWTDEQRVARLLAWLAVYEWRLADWWMREHLSEFEKQLRVGGQLSWIRTVREWVARQVRQFGAQALAYL
jgi:Transposase DDE domain